jgi:hypothetical protein
MFLMFGDEADAEQGRGQKFFVYGAIFVEVDAAKTLHTAIRDLRDKNGFAATESLKFADSTRPQELTREEFRDVKKEAIRIAKVHDVKFCAYLTSHALARNRTQDDLVLFGANTLLGKFDEFLGTDRDDCGIALMDRIPVEHPYRYLKEKFQTGLTFPNGDTRRLERVVGLASTTDGASHLASVADVLIGSFRYCVNEEERDIAGRAMFPDLVRLMWKRRLNGRNIVQDYGLVIRPQEVRFEPHKTEYQALIDRLQGYLNDA